MGGSAASMDAAIDRAAGSADSGIDASDAGQLGRCDALAPIRLYYRNGQVGGTSPMIDYLVKVANATGGAVPLDSLKIRYYFTNELQAPWTIDVFYSDTCCSNKIVNFNVLRSLLAIPATTNANAYLEIGFDAAVGSLAPGDAVQVELGFHDPGSGRTLTQTNDYSYRATAAGTQPEWDSCPGPQCPAKFTSCAMTVYRDDVLVWGTPP
jgi:hypothetical protein